jgi:hypothetical protein
MDINKIYYQINNLLESYLDEGIKPEHLLTYLNVNEDNYKFIYNRLYKLLNLNNIHFESEILKECLIDSIRDKISLYNDIKEKDV